MAYLLSADGRNEDFVAAWRRYEDSIASARDQFPPGALALASSDWYYDFNDHRCPHDAWLEHVTIREPSAGERGEVRRMALSARLLGAYHDGYIELSYPHVHSYRLGIHDGASGHGDWRYDEFRLSERGNLIHEIEWSGHHGAGTWLIEASDVEFRWVPR